MFLRHEFVGKCLLDYDYLHFVTIYLCLFESYSLYNDGPPFLLIRLHMCTSPHTFTS